MNNEKRSIYPPSRPSPNTAPSENKVSFMACSHFKCKINIKRFERKLKVTTTMEIEITLDKKKHQYQNHPHRPKLSTKNSQQSFLFSITMSFFVFAGLIAGQARAGPTQRTHICIYHASHCQCQREIYLNFSSAFRNIHFPSSFFRFYGACNIY